MPKKIIFSGVTKQNDDQTVQRFFRIKGGVAKLYKPIFEAREAGGAMTIVFSSVCECDSEGNQIDASNFEMAIVLPRKLIDALAVANGSNAFYGSGW